MFFFFLISQVVVIYQGSCQSSPCSNLNNSADVNTWMDRYGEITTRPILAPSTLLIGPLLRSFGYEVEESTDIPLTYQHNFRDMLLSLVASPVVVYGVGFDVANESLDTRNNEGSFVEPDDIYAMREGYILSKLTALLSLPIWILYAFLLIKGWEKRGVARVFVSLIFILLCTSTLMSWMIIFWDAGTDIETWNIFLKSR